VIWDQIQYLLLFGVLHSLSLSVVTEYAKKVWSVPDILQRWMPLMLAFPVTFSLLPVALRTVDLDLALTSYESVAICTTGSILAASGSKFAYDVARLLRDDIIGAIRAKIKSYGGGK
jgi:hypothetical protein